MEKLNKSQMLKLFVIASLLIITPLLSTSHRSKYLYFILNILILLLGAEAGFLSFLLHSPQKNNKLFFPPDFSANEKADPTITTANQFHREICLQESICSEEKPSTPSIFFIGGAEENKEEKEEEGEEVVEEELFHKAETFIGNFYKQLKMQREESWKKLHDLYHHKAF